MRRPAPPPSCVASPVNETKRDANLPPDASATATAGLASARRRARGARAEVSELSEQLNDIHRQWDGDARRFTLHDQDSARVNAMMRTELARLQILAERAGWIPDAETRRLWRWREGWWELAYRKRNAKDGYHDSGWYLWGPRRATSASG